MAEEQQQGNINLNNNLGRLGMNMDNTPNQVNQGVVTYALNAAIENFDANSVNYQNEPGNEFCFEFPEGYQLIGKHFIQEKNKHIFFITNPFTGDSEIGYMDNNDCVYRTYINAKCLNFNVDYPIHKSVHKITNCTTQVYWTDGLNPRRFIDLDNPPWINKPGTNVCDNDLIPGIVDCNKLKVQPNYDIPQLEVVDIRNGGQLKAGTYQFAIQYCDAQGGGYTSYHSVTNPTPIANLSTVTLNFDYEVGKSIILNVNNIDITGYYKYFNIAVIKNINAVTSVELIGTYFIDDDKVQITYTGQTVGNIQLTVNDIFEKFPYYNVSQDVTSVRDILVWDNLTSDERVNYQHIANQIKLQWETWRIPAGENYADELNATNLRGYLRDEVYAFEIVFLLKNGKQTDGFHIPGRVKNNFDSYPDVPNTNNDFIGDPDYFDVLGVGYAPYWKIYNTAYKIDDSPGKDPTNPNYKGPWEYGGFGYWESTEVYPCNELVWGDLSNKPIRHHKFPDLRVSPIHENPTIVYQNNQIVPAMTQDAIYPIGVRVDSGDILRLISISNLTQEQKDNIVGYKIVRGDRATNKSIVAKGILRNVGKYDRQKTSYYYPNYPYNDLNEDPFLLSKSNSFTATNECRNYTITGYSNPTSTIEYVDCFTGDTTQVVVALGDVKSICSITPPKVIVGKACMVANTFSRYAISIIGLGVSAAKFRVTYPTGASCINPTPPAGSSFCDYCNTYPASPCCVNSTLVTGQFNTIEDTLVPFGPQYWVPGTVSWPAGTIIYVDSITPPVLTTVNGSPFFISIKEVLRFGDDICDPAPIRGFDYTDGGYRLVFNSPETSFGQPFLGDILKLETAMFGAGRAHFVEVKKNAMYRLLTKEAQIDALNSSFNVANITGTIDVAAMFTAYQAYLTIYINGITRRNYGYSFNSIASYDYWAPIDNNASSFADFGIKQRPLKIYQYLIPGVQNVGDDFNVNNFNRESSVYLKTDPDRRPLPFPDRTPSLTIGTLSLISDNTRFTIGDSVTTRGTDCSNPEKLIDTKVVAYYGSLKNLFINQWGQIYSYDTIDTGFQVDFSTLQPGKIVSTVFGGDTFISRFAFKTKLPFFIDNRVNAPDDSDIFYDEIGNVAYPKYWHSARSVLSNYDNTVSPGLPVGFNLTNIVSYKANNFDCPNSQLPAPPQPNINRTYYDGKMYMFAYGIPSFYCESSINVDLRQAFNNREGEYWPHVSTGIPDDWVQESFVPISQDNTYYYNISYSKQNKENFFSHLPVDWNGNQCFTYYPFRAIYSDAQQDYTDNSINSWLIYRPVSFFDFPQNYGNLTSLDGIQNKNVLARFENKTLLYNNLLTIDTSNPQAAYIGNDKLFAAAPPIDFADTDLGYVGSQHKFLLKIPYGQITVDAKRGNVFLITSEGARDLASFGSGMNRFFTDHLAFEILRYFPKVNIDNHFKNIGLHGVFDSKYDRMILTKLDYIPLLPNIVYDEADKEFYLVETVDGTQVKTLIYVTDEEYFCNKSWSISFNFNTMSWVSFHSYQPNWYIGENNFFYSGLNGSCFIDAFAGQLLDPTTTTTTSTTTSFCSCIKFVNASLNPSVVFWNPCSGFFGVDIVNPNGGILEVCGSNPIVDSPLVFYTIGDPCVFDGGINDYVCRLTTTTTSTTNPCLFDGYALDVTPRPITTTTTSSSSTSTTTTTSTTSTTTTLCPTCNTYLIENTEDCDKYFTITDCVNESLSLVVRPGLPIAVCSCATPVLPDGLTYTLLTSGCETSFCYSLQNTTTSSQDVLYADHNGGLQTVTIAAGDTAYVCLIPGSQVVPTGVTLTIGGACTTNLDCDPCNTTTTTTTTTI